MPMTSEWNSHVESDQGIIEKDRLEREEAKHKNDLRSPSKSPASNIGPGKMELVVNGDQSTHPIRSSGQKTPEYNIMIDVPNNPPSDIQTHFSIGLTPNLRMNQDSGLKIQKTSDNESLRNQLVTLSHHVEALNIENESLRRLVRQNSMPRSQTKLKRQESVDHSDLSTLHDKFTPFQGQDMMHLLMVQARVIEKCIDVL